MKKGNQPPKNNILVRLDIIIICEYSAKKNKAKAIAEYSVLYPDTNSDSPSVKSNGDRFVSAKEEIKNNKNAGNCGKRYQISYWERTIAVKFNSPELITIVKMINPNETSYEIICAEARIDPKNEYWQLELQPDIIIE